LRDKLIAVGQLAEAQFVLDLARQVVSMWRMASLGRPRRADHPAGQERRGVDRAAARMRAATIGGMGLRLDQIQLREGHWVIADLFGKGGRLRTVPVPDWRKALIDSWLCSSGFTEGLVFRRIWRNRTQLSRGIAPDVVWTAVKRYAKRIDVDHLAPHDLRRTCAGLCHGAGGELEQIQFLLGHASVQTTERYIGCRQKFKDAVNDRFQISLGSRPR